jgi:hypothetical protein
MALRELNQRDSDGILVTLYWNPESQTNLDIEPLEVHVFDARNSSVDFAIRCDFLEEALEAYRHPFGVATRALNSGKLLGAVA